MFISCAWFPGSGAPVMFVGHRPGCRCSLPRTVHRLAKDVATRIALTAPADVETEIGHSLAMAARYEQNPPADISIETARLVAYVARRQAARMRAHAAPPWA
jgi:hypothetical protein